MDWKPGDVGWFVPYDKRDRPYEVVVKSAARKWITTERGMRFDKGTGRVDGWQHSTPGRVWKSRAEAESYQRAWDIRVRIANGVLLASLDISEANAQQAAALLGIDVAGEP
jgi:hypothetical protein